MTKLPLEGIRILDATDVWAGPYTCTLLGDLGAEVIKVDSIQRFGSRGQLNPPDTRPDGTPPVMWAYPDGVPRTPGTQPWNRVALYNGINRNKLGITLNLRDPQGKDLFKRLAAISDVVIDNYATGVFARLGLGYDDLKEVKEDIIVISMPLFGNYGTYSQYKGLGSTADPISGHATLRGYLGEDPTGFRAPSTPTPSPPPPRPSPQWPPSSIATAGARASSSTSVSARPTWATWERYIWTIR